MQEFQQDTKNIWFSGQKEPIYDPSDEEAMAKFRAYWKREKDRCINGFDLADGQVHISGWLYWHTTYWKIAAYKEDDGKKRRKIITPILRDTDWIVNGDFEECEKKGKFYNLVGSRDWGKSIIGASRAGYQYSLFNKSESLISGGADNYIKLATDKIEDGLTNIHPIWKKNRLANDWKREIKAGWKDKTSNQIDPKSSNSTIIMRNYENGIKSMAAQGARPGFHLIDEIGTILHLIACLKDSEPCWYSDSDTGGDGRPSCLVMATGTGGDMEVGAEAGEIFFNPIPYNMLDFDNPETGGRMGRFIDALMSRMRFKEEQSLAEYLGIHHPDLENITILVTNRERALKEWWEPAYAKAMKSSNQKAITKFLAYWPLKPSHCFLVVNSNPYNVEAAQKQQTKLRTLAQGMHDGVIGQRVEIFHDGTQIRHKHSEKYPITEFPVKSQNTDAPVIMWEPPISGDPPWGLYIAGVDPYRQDSAEYSESLGAVYIYKRMHEIASEHYQDMFVAAYVARPGKVDDWNEQARLLIKYYNAFTLCENDDMTFIRYMQNKGDDYYLADQPQWLKDVVPFSTVNRGKGIHRSSEKVRNFLRTCFKRYLDEQLGEEVKEDETKTEILGVSRVQDIMLLEEVCKFHKDGNFDREVAASLAVALADKMEPLGKVMASGTDPRYISYFSKKTTHPQNKMFIGSQNAFGPSRKNKRPSHF